MTEREVSIVVVEDNLPFLNKIKKIVEQFTFKNNINAKTEYFTEYDEGFLKVMNQKVSKRIYILDIDTPLNSGKDIARKIRKFDFNSIIIFVSTHEYMAQSIILDLLQVLTFIYKLDDCENKLNLALKIAIEILDSKTKFEFKMDGNTYHLDKHDILYITYNSKKRKVIIITSDEQKRYEGDLKLKECLELLGAGFKFSHRSCIVNMNRILFYNKEEIIFDNKEKTNLISDMFFSTDYVLI